MYQDQIRNSEYVWSILVIVQGSSRMMKNWEYLGLAVYEFLMISTFTAGERYLHR